MAKYRLRVPHELEEETRDGIQRVWLPGDTTNESQGEERGTVVGDGTKYKVKWPTLEMIPLDDEAREMIAREENRLMENHGVMNPVDALPIDRDAYEDRYIPGMDGVRRVPPLPDGATIGTKR